MKLLMISAFVAMTLIAAAKHRAAATLFLTNMPLACKNLHPSVSESRLSEGLYIDGHAPQPTGAPITYRLVASIYRIARRRGPIV